MDCIGRANDSFDADKFRTHGLDSYAADQIDNAKQSLEVFLNGMLRRQAWLREEVAYAKSLLEGQQGGIPF